MLKLKTSLLLISLIVLNSCFKDSKKTKILVIGDVQLNSDLTNYTIDDWRKQSMDTTEFKKLFNEVISKESPDFIFQTGDWVNSNDNKTLVIRDSLTNEIERHFVPYSEWDFMNKQLDSNYSTKFYITMGNHESYKSVELNAVSHPDYNFLLDVNVDIQIADKQLGKKTLIDRFPNLKNAVFNGFTASYYIEKDSFSLLSIDGLDRDREELLNFIESSLKTFDKDKPIFVMSHYPIFTGLNKEKDNSLVYYDIRKNLIELFDKYQVDVFLNGHEHFYLRYNDEEQRKLFEGPYPIRTKYITVSDFCNPYSREIKRSKNSKPMFYYEGTHYMIIEIENNEVSFKTMGYDEISNKWTLIDQFKTDKYIK